MDITKKNHKEWWQAFTLIRDGLSVLSCYWYWAMANRLCEAKIKMCLNKGSRIYMKTENVKTEKNGGSSLLSLCKLLMVYFFKESAMKGRANGGLVVWWCFNSFGRIIFHEGWQIPIGVLSLESSSITVARKIYEELSI